MLSDSKKRSRYDAGHDLEDLDLALEGLVDLPERLRFEIRR